MPMLAYIYQLFSAEQCQAYIHTLRWKDRPLQCPRCHSQDVAPWGTNHYRPGCQRYWCHGCKRTLLKPYLRVFRGISKFNLPGYVVGFLQFLRNFRQQNAFEQAELILRAALDPAIASRAKKGEFVKCFDRFELLQTAIN